MRIRASMSCGVSVLALSSCALGQPAAATRASRIPTPASVIGHEVGQDYKLARWETIVDYFENLAAASDRIRVRRLEDSTEGHPYLLCEISAPQTLKQLDRYQALQAKLADPRRIAGDAERSDILSAAKTTILVTCGLHSSEVAASQMAMKLAYELATATDDRTREILDNTIILLVPSANPDGHNKIIDWYEKQLATPYEGGPMPWLYQKYAGHDNNRDWYMLNLKETRILTHVLYREWFPTILYDIHQMGNRGSRFFVPPFFDPVNPNVDPLIHQSLLLIGGHMATELQENGKTGVVFKAIYDNWWAGGNRTTPYRHNIVGILTEAASAKVASPIFQEYHELGGHSRGLPEYAPAVNFPQPWPGGWWRLRDIVEYEKIACQALFTLAARYRERFIKNHLELSEKAIRLGQEQPPFAWLVPPAQRDPGAAARLLEVLHLTGIEVHRAKAPFTADGVEYPAGTHVLLAAQPYRPHLKDMMERQEYPDRRIYPEGPAEPPYDSAGWTLPLQMGVRSIEVVSPFNTPLTLVESSDFATHEPPDENNAAAAYLTKRNGNVDYQVVNALLEAGFPTTVLRESHQGFPPGSIVVSNPSDPTALLSKLRESLARIPARFDELASLPPPEKLQEMVRPRTGLYQPWTANMDEGWTRFVLEQFDFPYTTLHNADIRAGQLHERFDCIILPDQRLNSILNGISDKEMPPPYAGGIGLDGAMELERFAQRGGTLVLLDSATELATELLRVPVRNVVQNVPSKDFYCPGSLLRIRVDPTHPLAFGMDAEAAAFFAGSCAFETGEAALLPQEKSQDGGASSKNAESSAPPAKDDIKKKVEAQPVTTAARYSDNILLLSGWILGGERILNKAAVCEVRYGEGRIVLLGFRAQHRGQPHGTFKFLFNAIYQSAMR